MTPEREPRAIEVEKLCGRESLRILNRRFFRVLSLYLLSLSGFLHGKREFSGNPLDYAKGIKSDIDWGLELGCVARSVYFFLRHVDDILDGDLETSEDPLLFVANLSSQIKSDKFTGGPEIGRLVQYSLEVLERKARPEDNPRQSIIDILGVMAFDYQRSVYRQALSAEQLKNYYHCTFFPLMDLMLIGFESQVRASDIPALPYSQGRVYCIKDLETDWQRGIINVPREVLEEGKLTADSPLEEVKGSPVVTSWLSGELLKSRSELLALQAWLEKSPERFTRTACNSMIKPILRYINKYAPRTP